ncbi:OFA family MFS transporter [Actinomadura atramentaria]|uniref:OFA family MFS transporter n=1 Tax=Actinomadura atramentaria TaxID=1990 RepID=UPI00036FBC7F|nr:OFA family MFS transporter [Actinomadura atramentaria]
MFPSRRAVVCAAVVFQVALGGVYSWSVFARALQRPGSGFGLGHAEAVLPFSVAIGVVFVGTTLGGRLQDRRGPRAAALLGGALYSLGALLASLATGADRLWLLLLAYGVVGGLGLGIAYIVPVAMLQKWFPERRGLITGIAVGGFGFGAVLVSPVAQWLVDHGHGPPTRAFLPLGLAYLVLTTFSALLFRNPPRPGGLARTRAARSGLGGAARSGAGWDAGVGGRRAGGRPGGGAAGADRSGGDLTCAAALRTRQWYLLTAMLTLNTVSGIGFVAVTAGAAGSITGMGPAGAAALTGGMGLANGGGRVLWGWLSERLGRMRTFALILALMGLCLLAVPYATSPVLFVPLAAVVFASFGGGYAVMPATTADFFGLAHAGAIYGLMNVAWSIGGVVGPLLVAALVSGGDYRTAFMALGALALAATALPALTRPPGRRRAHRRVLPPLRVLERVG